MLLTVVVTFNLPGCLINFVKSYLTYCDLGELLVVDNQSTDPQLRNFINSIQSERIIVKIMDIPNCNDQKVGGLYQANNFALEYAKKENYKYILFCQDDMQFFRFDRNLELNLEILYSDSTTSMVNPTVMKGVDERFFKGYKWNPNIKSWICLDYAVIDVAIISIQWAIKNDFKFLNSEAESSMALNKKKYFVAVLNEPFLVYLPWPPVRRYGLIVGKDLPISNELFFSPIKRINLIKEGQGVEIPPPTIYECCMPNYAKVLQPYWYTDIMFYPLTIKSLFKNRYVGKGSLRIPGRFHFVFQVALGLLIKHKKYIKTFFKKINKSKA